MPFAFHAGCSRPRTSPSGDLRQGGARAAPRRPSRPSVPWSPRALAAQPWSSRRCRNSARSPVSPSRPPLPTIIGGGAGSQPYAAQPLLQPTRHGQHVVAPVLADGERLVLAQVPASLVGLHRLPRVQGGLERLRLDPGRVGRRRRTCRSAPGPCADSARSCPAASSARRAASSARVMSRAILRRFARISVAPIHYLVVPEGPRHSAYRTLGDPRLRKRCLSLPPHRRRNRRPSRAANDGGSLPVVLIGVAVLLVGTIAAAPTTSSRSTAASPRTSSGRTALPSETPDQGGAVAAADQGPGRHRRPRLRAARLRQPRPGRLRRGAQRLDHGRAPQQGPRQGLHHLLPARHVGGHPRPRQEQDQRRVRLRRRPADGETLESLLDIRMDHVVLVDFEGFIDDDRVSRRGHGQEQDRVHLARVRLSEGRDHHRRRGGAVVRPRAQEPARRRPRPRREPAQRDQGHRRNGAEPPR